MKIIILVLAVFSFSQVEAKTKKPNQTINWTDRARSELGTKTETTPQIQSVQLVNPAPTDPGPQTHWDSMVYFGYLNLFGQISLWNRHSLQLQDIGPIPTIGGQIIWQGTAALPGFPESGIMSSLIYGEQKVLLEGSESHRQTQATYAVSRFKFGYSLGPLYRRKNISIHSEMGWSKYLHNLRGPSSSVDKFEQLDTLFLQGQVTWKFWRSVYTALSVEDDFSSLMPSGHHPQLFIGIGTNWL